MPQVQCELLLQLTGGDSEPGSFHNKRGREELFDASRNRSQVDFDRPPDGKERP